MRQKDVTCYESASSRKFIPLLIHLRKRVRMLGFEKVSLKLALCWSLQVLIKALQLHPTVAGLWSYAAAWEFEHNANAAAARALMQRGLRMCPRSPQVQPRFDHALHELSLVSRARERDTDASMPVLHWDPGCDRVRT